MMVPIQVIRWYRMQCYDGTDSCATVVPIRRYCQVKVYAEKRTAIYRNQEFEYIFLCYQCVDTKEKFTTTELDCFNTLQVYKQYKKRFNTSRGEKA